MKTPDSRHDPDQVPTKRVAVYVRMSKEHRQYSTDTQMDVIREYAARSGMEIVITDSGEGKNGFCQQP